MKTMKTKVLNALETIAHTNIPVGYKVWVLSRAILYAAALGTLYCAAIMTPYSWSNLMLAGMGIYVLCTAHRTRN